MAETTPPSRRFRSWSRAGWLAVVLGCVAAGVWILPWRHAGPSAREQRTSGGSTGSVGAGALGVVVVALSDPNGKPVVGAQVQIVAGNSFRREALSDARGEVRFEPCPAEPLRLRAEKRGLLRADATLDAHANATKIAVLHMAWGARLEGKIQDETGAAVRDASVLVRTAPSAAHPGTSEPWTATSDQSGSFVIDTLPAGGVAIEASAARHDATALRSVVVPTSSAIAVVLQRTAAVLGSVSDPKGQAAARAQVTIAGSGVWPARTVTCDDHGKFRFDPLPEGIYELRAQRGALISEPVEGLSVDPGGEAHVDLQLSPGARLDGRAYDAATGQPVVGAQVQLLEDALSAAPHDLLTGSDGSFSFAGVRAITQRLSLRVPGYVAYDGWAKPGGKPAALALLRAGSIAGQVLDEAGAPIAQADIEVEGVTEIGTPVHMSSAFVAPLSAAPPSGAPAAAQLANADNLGVMRGGVPAIPLSGPAPSTAPSTPAQQQAAAFRSDAQGAFRLEGLPPGALSLIARHSGFASSTRVAVTLHSGQQKQDLVVHMQRGGQIEGRLLDPHDEPVSHVRVELVVDGEPAARSALTSRDGSFHFDAVLGRCTVTAYPYGLPPVRGFSEIKADETQQLPLVLGVETQTLRGQVQDDRGHGIESAAVNVRALNARTPFALTVLSGAGGAFEISGLPTPPFSVTADQPEYAAGKPIKVSSTANELVIELAAGAELHGAVVDGDANQPLVAARVRLTAPWLQSPRTARSDAEGLFEFQRVSEGNYTIFVEANGFISEQRQVLMPSSSARAEQAPETFVLIPSGSASGDVVDRRGVPVWNAEVAAGDPADWSHATRSDHAGHFVLSELAPGELVLHARHVQAGELAVAAPVRVYPRQETPGLVLRLPEIADAPEAANQPSESEAKTASSAEPALHPATLGLHFQKDAVVVDAVPERSAAARAGLRAGDLLVTVDGERVRSPAQARGMLQGFGPAARVLEVRRGSSLHRLRYQP